MSHLITQGCIPYVFNTMSYTFAVVGAGWAHGSPRSVKADIGTGNSTAHMPLIECHWKGEHSPGQSQHNIVDNVIDVIDRCNGDGGTIGGVGDVSSPSM